MNTTTKVLIGVTTATILTTSFLVYKSISISQDAYNKVTKYSQEMKLTLRDTASKMILEWNNPKIKDVSHLTLGNDEAPFLVDFARDTTNGYLRNDVVHVRLKDNCTVEYNGTSTETYGTTTVGYEHYNFVCK